MDQKAAASLEAATPKDGVGNGTRTPLQEAAAGSQEKVVAALLEAGAQVEAVSSDDEGMRALHLACCTGGDRIVQQLLQAGADIHARDGTGWTALHVACKQGQAEVVQVLVAAGADIEAIALGGWQAIHRAALWGHSQVIHALLDGGADIEAKGVDDCRPIHYAAMRGHIKVLEALVERGCDLFARDGNGSTVLHCAAGGGQLQTVQWLVVKNIPHTILDGKNRTAEETAQIYGYHQVKWWLHKQSVVSPPIQHTQANVSMAEYERIGQISVKWAAEGKHTNISAHLPSRPWRLHYQDWRGWTPLHHAAYNNKRRAAEALVALGACRLALNHEGHTPADLAHSRGHLEVSNLLTPPLPTMTSNERVKLYEQLLQVIVRVEVINDGCKDGKGEAIRRLEAVQEVTRLVTMGAPLEPVRGHTVYPLHLAVSFNCTDIVPLLLSVGAPLTSTTEGLGILQQAWLSPDVTTNIAVSITRVIVHRLEYEKSLAYLEGTQATNVLRSFTDGIMHLLDDLRGKHPWLASWPLVQSGSKHATNRFSEDRPETSQPLGQQEVEDRSIKAEKTFEEKCTSDISTDAIDFSKHEDQLTRLLILACQLGATLTTSFLVRSGASTAGCCNTCGQTALHAALESGQLQTAVTLVRHLGANIFLHDFHGRLPLTMCSLEFGQTLQEDSVSNDYRVLDSLINRGPSAMEKEIYVHVVLLLAVLFKHAEACTHTAEKYSYMGTFPYTGIGIQCRVCRPTGACKPNEALQELDAKTNHQKKLKEGRNEDSGKSGGDNGGEAKINGRNEVNVGVVGGTHRGQSEEIILMTVGRKHKVRKEMSASLRNLQYIYCCGHKWKNVYVYLSLKLSQLVDEWRTGFITWLSNLVERTSRKNLKEDMEMKIKREGRVCSTTDFGDSIIGSNNSNLDIGSNKGHYVNSKEEIKTFMGDEQFFLLLDTVSEIESQEIEIQMNDGWNDFLNRIMLNGFLIACKNNLITLIHLILTIGEVEINTAIEKVSGSTALHIAAAYGYSGLCKFLVSLGASNKSLDHAGRTPAHLAFMFGHSDVGDILMTGLENDRDMAISCPRDLLDSFKECMKMNNLDVKLRIKPEHQNNANSLIVAHLTQLKNRCRGDIATAVKEFHINFTKGEAKEVKQIITYELKRIIQVIEKINPLFASSLNIIGKPEDNLCLYVPNGFEYNVMLKHITGFPGGGFCVSMDQLPEDIAQLKGYTTTLRVSTSSVELKSFTDSETFVNTFFEVLSASVTSFKPLDYRLSLVIPGIRKTKVGASISFAWQGSEFPLLFLDVHIVPVVNIPWPNELERPPMTPSTIDSVQITATGDGNWRYSFAAVENLIFRELSESKRGVLLACKLLTDSLKVECWATQDVKESFTFWDGHRFEILAPADFLLKSAFLREMEDVQDDSLWKTSYLMERIKSVFGRMCIMDNISDTSKSSNHTTTNHFDNTNVKSSKRHQYFHGKLKSYFGGHCEKATIGFSAPEILSFLDSW
ncbi:hypothetical protein Pcinc_005754 [Petrolisthes cinctipes]|uniref:Uncharacterized protein n=1 Tax=Petrolisthes cinctipes TaxID=88211 RepID=A0AAE1GBW9_PETCI|nr:hypothetical protein Pcinc_005754 [Petrolisthes cinctipes]